MTNVINIIQAVYVQQNIIPKTVTFLAMNLRWDSIDSEPFVYYYFYHGKSILVVSNKDLIEFGKSISQH